MTKNIVERALAVAKKYPVFPTINKKPTWSNAALGVKKGEGGYKISTQDPDRVRELFSHPRAEEIAVPMGEMSGLLCVDVDVYKEGNGLQKWVDDHGDALDTLTHKTRSGGLHFIFKHPGDGFRFPATLRPGVDLKANGTGYVCWPGTDGYERIGTRHAPKPAPLKLIEEALKAKGGTGSMTPASGSFNNASDDELVASILAAEELYPALRTLAYRLAGRVGLDAGLTRATVVQTLYNVVDSSVAAQVDHPRHDDWLDRREKIEELVDSALEKLRAPVLDDAAIAALAQETSLIDDGAMIATARPIGPQRETTAEDIEARIEKIDPQAGFRTFSAGTLRGKRLEPIKWIIPRLLPAQSTISLGGSSGVGKTRWLASVVMSAAVGDVERMGLPAMAAPCTSIWIANEERVDDIERRCKAVALQYGDTKSLEVSVRGKDSGMLRLVALNEVGTLELDEVNIAIVVAEARRVGAKIIVFDPYVTLSDAADENSAASAAMLTKAFIMIANLTGACVLHAHHTPKDRAKYGDWYRGDPGAWRGSGAIYSGLDAGVTLAPWMPRNPEQRKQWKAAALKLKLKRFIVLDSGKMRDGLDLDPVMYEMLGQEMDEGEGEPIAICRLSNEAEAGNCLLDDAIDRIRAVRLGEALLGALGAGKYASMSEVHKAMRGHEDWPASKALEARHLESIHADLGEPVLVSGGSVVLKHYPERAKNGRWILIIKEDDDD